MHIEYQKEDKIKCSLRLKKNQMTVSLEYQHWKDKGDSGERYTRLSHSLVRLGGE